jgi:MFS superfamily sulfate permease-like transporter
MEWAGAFGDLGTLIPFVVAYIVIWLVLGITGAAKHIARLVPRFVVVGIVLGLGINFTVEGVKMMSGGWLLAAVGLVGTVLLLTNKAVPAMFLLLIFGIGWGAIQHPEMLQALAATQPEIRVPRFAFAEVTWHDMLVGTAFLALPQLPLTLGNAIIAIREENNRLFPDRPITENTVAVWTGVVNLAGAAFGGVPMCHGAGGMAGHVAFGARTGGAPIILGALLLCLALFFSGSIEALFGLFARPVLGVILFLTGVQLALGSCDFSKNKGERFVTLTTAAFAMWNVGLAFVAGMTFAYIAKRRWLRL